MNQSVLPMDQLLAHGLPLICIYIVVYLFGGAVYRLYFSPLAKFPGPKLAALTLWYEFYYDVLKKGRYSWEIGKMHEKYGPIVRINPYELHVNDPEFLDVLYVGASVRRSMKYPWAMKMFGNGDSSFETVDHHLHRLRRGAIAPFFSRAAVQKLEDVVQTVVDKAVVRLHQLRGSGAIVNLPDFYSSLTGDLIGQYALASSYNLLDGPEFSPQWHRTWMETTSGCHVLSHFGWLAPMMQTLPLKVVNWINPSLVALFTMLEAQRARIIEVKSDLKKGRKGSDMTTILYDILTNDQIRPEEKDTEHLKWEFNSLVAAGTLTTAHTLSILTFHILTDSEILERLQKELQTVMPDADSKPNWVQLEKLPYLNAVVAEGLRIGYGVSHRLQRLSPDVALQYKDWKIPINTPVSMTSVLIHDNPDLFPNPRTFSPDRWLQPSGAQLRKYIFSFGRGSRQCAGMNLAYCELFLTLAAVFAPQRFKLKLFETDISDVEIKHDFFNTGYRLDSKGIRLTVN